MVLVQQPTIQTVSLNDRGPKANMKSNLIEASDLLSLSVYVDHHDGAVASCSLVQHKH